MKYRSFWMFLFLVALGWPPYSSAQMDLGMVYRRVQAELRSGHNGQWDDGVMESRYDHDQSELEITAMVTLGGAFCLASQSDLIVTKGDTVAVQATSSLLAKQPEVDCLTLFTPWTTAQCSFTTDKKSAFQFAGSASQNVSIRLTISHWDSNSTVSIALPQGTDNFDVTGEIPGVGPGEFVVSVEFSYVSELALNFQEGCSYRLSIYPSEDVGTARTTWGMVKSLYH